MAIPCTKPVSQKFQSRRSGAKMAFSSKQAEMFRRIAHEARMSALSPRTGGLAFSSSSGLLAVFSGLGSTGKTMAAEVMARELRTSVYRVNLNQVVSQYIGETEKNLVRVFEVARKKGAVLLFDEADALFGKRSEVKDSHERYANIELNYLLAKIEAYRGLLILSSNHSVDIDPAIMCRVKYLLEFSSPTPAPHMQPRP